MKIVHAVHGFPPEFRGGTEQYVAKIAEAQAARGHQVTVLAGSHQSSDPPTLAEDVSTPVRVMRYRGLPTRSHHWSEFADPIAEELIRQFLVTERPDVLHVHHWMRLTSRLVAIAAELGIPAAVTLHDTWSVCPRIFRLKGDLSYCEEVYRPDLCQTCAPRQPWQGDDEVAGLLAERYRHLARELEVARQIAVPSRAHQAFLSQVTGLSRDRFELLAHPSLVTLTPSEPASGTVLTPRSLKIGCLGSLVPHKGQDVLLRALPFLPEAPPWEIHVFGSPEDRSFSSTLRTLAGGFPVTFHGVYRPEDLWMTALDVVVFPSLAPESFSFTLDEVLQLGLPVIVSDRGALGERAGDAGVVVPAEDPEALAKAIRRILEDPALLSTLRAQARERSSNPLDAHLARLDVLYDSARRDPISRTISIEEVSAQARRLHRQLLEREAQIREREAQRAHLARQVERLQSRAAVMETQIQGLTIRLDYAQTALHVVTQTRGWRFLSLIREIMGLRSLSLARLRLLWRFFLTCFAPSKPARHALAQARGEIEQQYQIWLALHTPQAGQLEKWRAAARRLRYRPLISLITPVYNVEELWLRRAIESVQGQVYDRWELCLVNDASSAQHIRPVLDTYAKADGRIRVAHLPKRQGIVGASNTGMAMATGEFLGFLDHDDELAPHALYTVAAHLNRSPATDLIYTDEDKIDEQGYRFYPAFKPDWSPDLFRSMNYLGHLCVLRTDLVRKLERFREGFDGSQDYDLLLRATEVTDRIAHIPDVLYSWRTLAESTAGSLTTKTYAYEAAARALEDSLRRRGVLGKVRRPAPGRYTVRYQIEGTPLVSVIIPMRDRGNLTRQCLESVERKTTYRHYEALIVDNGSAEPASVDFLREAGRRHRVLRYDAPFNFSAIINFAAKEAQGEYLLFLNNDTQVISPHWMEAMLEHAQRPEVGAVGARLLYADGRIQHAGVFIMGIPTAVAGHMFKFLPAKYPGYLAVPRMIQNCTAVTAACMMVRRQVFESVGGFDQAFRVAFGDVDFCLRLRDLGMLVVYTPLATLFHYESASRGTLHPPEDDRLFRDRWRRFFEGARDPYWNPNLSVESEIFRLAV